VSPSAPIALSVLLLSEDGSAQAPAVLEALARKILRWLEPTLVEDRVRLEPSNDREREAMRGHTWKGRDGRGHHARVALARRITTKVLERDGFVFVHVDGDCAWSERRDGACVNEADFDGKVGIQVRQGLTDVAAKHPGVNPVERASQRILFLVPHHSIEAWLYQAHDAALRLCETQYGGRDAERFRGWKSAPHELDEVSKPKDATCLGNKHNDELAKVFPAPAVHALGKSFAATVERIAANAALREALAKARRDAC
jgi:hypothetical protein